MTNPLVSGLTGLNGINVQLDIGIPEIDVADIDPTGFAGSYFPEPIGGYSGLFNTVVIDSNDDAHAIFYNHNELQEVVNNLPGWIRKSSHRFPQQLCWLYIVDHGSWNHQSILLFEFD